VSDASVKRGYIVSIHAATNHDYAPLPKAINASALAGVFLPLAKGARIPSTADDDCAETRKAVLRAEACFR
jgi:hypothetical protein